MFIKAIYVGLRNWLNWSAVVIWYICKCNELIKTWVKNISYVIHHTQSVHDVPKCMSCHKDIVVITARAHCFHDSIYIMLILQLWDLSTLCVVDHLWPFKYIYIYEKWNMKSFYNETLTGKRFHISFWHILFSWFCFVFPSFRYIITN